MKKRTPDSSKRFTVIRGHRARFIFFCAGLFMIALYNILKRIDGVPRYIYTHIIHPFHNMTASLLDFTGGFAGEYVIIALVVSSVMYLIGQIVSTVRPGPGGSRIPGHRRIFRALVNIGLYLVTTVIFIYGGFCILWGFYYSAPGVAEVCGFTTDGVEHDDLVACDRYFLSLANEYSGLVNRDEDGYFVFSDESYDHSTALYDTVSETFPLLKADPHRPKRVRFSGVVSHLNFAGFFFPFTGEACINMDAPDGWMPATIAHELAHQRGIGAEDEANFIGILACMEDGSCDYVYSASVMGLVHLQNAVYRSGDIDAWEEIRAMYTPELAADLDLNNAYWSQFRDKVTYKATSQTYDAFLKSYDQTMGRETYGACVDYLVYYYKGMY